MNPSEIARAITAVLGEENIESATHCMTRLRLHLKEQNDHKREALKKIPGVLGVNMSGKELQVVLGPELPPSQKCCVLCCLKVRHPLQLPLPSHPLPLLLGLPSATDRPFGKLCGCETRPL